jgi:hypothetical protein
MEGTEVNQGFLEPHPGEPFDPNVLKEIFFLFLTVLGKNKDPMASSFQPPDKRHEKGSLNVITPVSGKRGGQKADVQMLNPRFKKGLR